MGRAWLTPTAARWLAPGLEGLAALSGHPVRYEYKTPGDPDVWPRADVVLLAPATFNTINEWALGLTSKFVVGVAAEGIGKGLPLVTMPCVNTAYVQHPQFPRSVDVLRSAGVTVLYGKAGSSPTSRGRVARRSTRGIGRWTRRMPHGRRRQPGSDADGTSSQRARAARHAARRRTPSPNVGRRT